jgi:hypothetical protein
LVVLYIRVFECLSKSSTRWLALLGPVIVLLPFYRLVIYHYTAIDGSRWAGLLKWLLIACYFAIVHSYALFVLLWVRLRRMLRRLAMHPLAEAFQRLPESCSASPWKLWSAVPNATTLAASVAQLRSLVNLGLGGDVDEELRRLTDRAERVLGQAFDYGTTNPRAWIGYQRALRDVLSEASMALTQDLETAWRSRPGARTELPASPKPEDSATTPTAEWVASEQPSGRNIWIRAAEEFLALRTSAFIRAMFQHLQNLLGFTFMSFLLIVGAISFYPFQPRYGVMTLVWVVVLGSVTLDALIFIDMERDTILSYIGKTKPGKIKLSLDFVTTVAIYIVMPVLTLLATQFPGVGDIVFSVFAPAMKSLSK